MAPEQMISSIRNWLYVNKSMYYKIWYKVFEQNNRNTYTIVYATNVTIYFRRQVKLILYVSVVYDDAFYF